MVLFEWTPEYSVSVLRFDSEHKKLFALVNELNDAMSAGRGRAIVARVLHELTDYARRHFAGEEEAMPRRLSWPGGPYRRTPQIGRPSRQILRRVGGE